MQADGQEGNANTRTYIRVVRCHFHSTAQRSSHT